MVVTIKDVAKMANVAPSTVSRVIANNPRISEKTKARVREVMEQLGYYPNFQARSLAAKSTKSIGVIMPNSAFYAFQNPFFPEVLRGISTKAHASKFGIYLSTGGTEEEIYEEVTAMVQGSRVDGIVLLYSRADDKVMKLLEKTEIPFTVIGRPYTNEEFITYVDNDNIMSTKKVTEHLIEHGHRNIAFIGGNIQYMVTRDRLTGYQYALAEAGIDNFDFYVIHEEFMKENGKESIKSLMSLAAPPTALVTQDDLMAYEIISYLMDMNINVPKDVSIVSFNNLILSEHIKPPLSSVDINIFELGYQAMDCLIEKINNPNTLPKRITIPTKFVERKSCSPARR